MTDEAPIATYRYTLTSADALVYERLPKELPGVPRIALYVWLGLAGFELAALPPELVGEPNAPRFWLAGAVLVLVQYGLYRIARAVTRLNRARHAYPRPADFVLTQWPDRLAVERDGGTAITTPFAEIGALLPTAAYLFIAAGDQLVIVPATAFGAPAAMQALVEAIDAFAAEPPENAAMVDVPAANP